MKTTRKGDSGELVKEIQRTLDIRIDGQFGPGTERQVYAFQKANNLEPDGIVGPQTWNALNNVQVPVYEVTLEQLQSIMKHAGRSVVQRFVEPINRCLKEYNINTKLRVAHFLAQIGHESGSFRYTEEIASGRDYEGRADLGNTEKGDGERFKGRGLIQLTGRANYSKYSKYIGRDLVSEPEKVSDDLGLAVNVAGWFWMNTSLNKFADRDEIRTVTKRINGGLNGLRDRQDYLDRANAVLS